jgi:hypothetical protein
MSDEQPVQLRLSAEGKEGSASLSVIRFTKGERGKRAVKALALCWIAAIAAIAIPVLHFILVPLLILAGPLAAYVVYRQEAVIPRATLICPKCAAEVPLSRTAPNWPIFAHCGSCSSFVKAIPTQANAHPVNP